MADASNPGQFGNREDTEEQARQGGENSTGQFGAENGMDPQEAGQKGAEAQPREAKVEGGEKGRAKSQQND